MVEPRQFHGDGERRCEPLQGAYNQKENYRADEELSEAVNAALFLRRPLLLEGDPGAGKTRLSYAVAWELGFPLYTCYVRSASRAEDLLYHFDQLNRLYDIQAASQIGSKPKIPKEKKFFRRFKPLGKAIQLSCKGDSKAPAGIPSVVLIDEIDKADIDFPNDLLQVLEEWRFNIPENDDEEIDALYDPETGNRETIADRRDFLPLTIITSNRERELPAAFLRRCLYFYIDFPDEDKLRKIIEAHNQNQLTPLFENAVAKFMSLRSIVQWIKPPGASELLDWIKLLENEEKRRKLTSDELEKMELGKLPHLETLIKTGEDRAALYKVMKTDHESDN